MHSKSVKKTFPLTEAAVIMQVFDTRWQLFTFESTLFFEMVGLM